MKNQERTSTVSVSYIVPLTAVSSTRRVFGRRDTELPKAVELFGNKARGLQTLAQRGFRVPRAFVCLANAATDYTQNPPAVTRALQRELSRVLSPDTSYAIRSSANLEDGTERSFAGQFASELDVRGPDAALEAIRLVWASADSARVREYLAQAETSPGTVRMAVIIQEMVTPHFSGVAFSRNPTTGLDETVVEVVAGRGDALVQDGVTPERWVDKWGGWLLRPARPTAPESLLRQVVAETRAIATAWGAPVDLEWTYDGAALYWLQVRAITTGAAVEIYSNRIAREVLPGMIKPLVWSVNVPLVNGAWVRLFTELVGPNDIDPSSLARAFYYRAYFNMGAIGSIFAALGMPRDALELLLGIEVPGATKPSFKPTRDTLLHTPRMAGFVARKWRFDRQVERFLPSAAVRFNEFQRNDLDQIDASCLLHEIDRLYALAQETAYYNIVTPLLLQVQSRLLDACLRRLGVDPARLDPAQGLRELQELNPNSHLQALSVRFAHLPADVQRAILADPANAPPVDAAAFQRALGEFLQRFGHFSDSGNDFSAVPWRENRPLIMKMVADGLAQGTGAERTLSFGELPLSRPQQVLLGPLYRRVRSYRLYREQISSLYTFGYGLLRDYFRALGRHLVNSGFLSRADDIFFLYLNEVRQVVAGGSAAEETKGLVARRRQEMDAYRDVSLPSLIYGPAPPPLGAAADAQLVGTPTSRGYYRGPARVIRGLHEFDRLQPGDVLVIPYSDVGWTPLFRKAGAVIAEAGGILSHSSIVAREYGIPAVVSAPNACRIPDGVAVTVDGYSGRILIHEMEKE